MAGYTEFGAGSFHTSLKWYLFSNLLSSYEFISDDFSDLPHPDLVAFVKEWSNIQDLESDTVKYTTNPIEHSVG